MDSERQRIKRERSIRALQALTLAAGIAALAIIGFSQAGIIAIPTASGPTAIPSSPSPSTDSSATRPAITRTVPGSESTLGATLSPGGPGTPADPWAEAILDRILPLLTGSPPSGDGLAWWQNSDLQGRLAITGDTVLIGDAITDTRGLLLIRIDAVDPTAPNRLLNVGTVDWQGGALHLTVVSDFSDQTGSQWLLSSTDVSVAIRALVVRATEREVRLLTAYSEQPGREAQLVLVGIEPLTSTATPTLRPTDPEETVHPTPTLLATRTPTATRVPEAYMGRVLAEKLDPVIDSVPTLNATDVSRATTEHPWAGELTWTENGPAIGGRAIPILAADTLYLYAAAPDRTDATRWLIATTDGQITRLPEEQIIFQGQRLNEILFWLVRRAGEREGQLVVTFDDFGIRQAVTVVGFKPFDSNS